MNEHAGLKMIATTCNLSFPLEMLDPEAGKNPTSGLAFLLQCHANNCSVAVLCIANEAVGLPGPH
jgi:hypothetical protein